MADVEDIVARVDRLPERTKPLPSSGAGCWRIWPLAEGLDGVADG